MIKNIILGVLFLSTLLFAGQQNTFNVSVKDLSVAGRKVRISPFKDIGVISVSLCFKNAGEKLSPKNKECLVSLLSKAMGDATASRTREQLQAYSLEHNLHISFSTTDDDFIIVGKCPPQKLAELFHLLKDILLHSKFNNRDIDRFKAEMIAGTMQSMQSPDMQLGELVKKTIWPQHPYGTSQETYLKSLKNISSTDLKSYMQTHFSQDNLIVSACGDINEEELAAQILAFTTSLPETFNFHLPENVKIVGPYKKYTQAFPVPQTVIRIVHEGIDCHHPDFFALQIAVGCLSNPGIGVLWQKVRTEKGLTYGIGAGFFMQDHANLFCVATSTQSETEERALEVIKEVLADVCKNGFSADLVETVKKSFLGNYKRSFESTGHIAARLIKSQREDRPVDFHNIVIEKISALTPEEVNDAFKKFLKLDQFIVFTVGK